MKKVWNWLKKAGVWIAAALVLVLGVGWLWRRKQSELGRVKDELAIARATSKIQELRAVREVLREEVVEEKEKIDEIDRDLVENRRAIAEAHEYGEGMNDEEIAEALARLGY